MNSTKILFLNMLKGDIKRYIYEKNANNNTGVLTGQTIHQEEIEKLSSYKLMNTDERSIVLELLNSMKKPTSGVQSEKVLLKSIPGLVPLSDTTETVEFKDAA